MGYLLLLGKACNSMGLEIRSAGICRAFPAENQLVGDLAGIELEGVEDGWGAKLRGG